MPDLEDASDTLPNDGIFNGDYDDDEDVGQISRRSYNQQQFKLRGKIQMASSSQQAIEVPKELISQALQDKSGLKQCKRNCFSSNYRSYIDATVAGKPVTISEASIRNDLLFDDADGIDSLNNQAIFDNLQLMGYEGDLYRLKEFCSCPWTTFQVLTLKTKKRMRLRLQKDPSDSLHHYTYPPPYVETTYRPQTDPSPRPSLSIKLFLILIRGLVSAQAKEIKALKAQVKKES
ncbi:hypothetical protein Tco_1283543 [Tanacetum coccineum]